MRKLRYRLHWNANGRPEYKWVIYDWKFKTPVAFAETRKLGRYICMFFNTLPQN